MKVTTAKTLVNAKLEEYFSCDDTQEREKYFELVNIIRETRNLLEQDEEDLVVLQA